MAPYDSKSIANAFLDRAWRDKEAISPMKLQKLIYFAHGWHLAIEECPLISDQVEAWPYGPVIPRIYHEFKRFGNTPITTLATDLGSDFQPEDVSPPKDEFVNQLIDRIWDVYGGYTAIQLSNLTHEEGGPWSDTVGKSPHRTGTDIPDHLLAEHFAAG